MRRRRSNFVPWRLPGLVMLIDSDASPVTLNGSDVSQIDDISQEGSPHNWTQGTASKQPAWTADASNGKRGMTFVRADVNALTTADHADFAVGNYTFVVIVEDGASATGNNKIIAQYPGGGNPSGYFDTRAGSTVRKITHYVAPDTLDSDDSHSLSELVMGIGVGDGTNAEVYVNNATSPGGTDPDDTGWGDSTAAWFSGAQSGTEPTEAFEGVHFVYAFWNTNLTTGANSDLTTLWNYYSKRFLIS